MTKRIDKIKQKVEAEGEVFVSDLSRLYNVTEETIRRDLEKLKNEGKVIDVIASYDELCNIDVSDIGVLWAYNSTVYEVVYGQITKITRFNSPQEFINSDLFKETDLVGLEGEELMEAINSSRNHVPVTDEDAITVYQYERVEK